MFRFVRLIVCAALVTAVPALAGESDDGFVIITPDQLVWRDVAAYPGLKFALLEGNPAEEGLYALRAKFPPGVMTAPHYHSRDRLVTVISGVWYAGTDDSFDRDKTIALAPGGFMKHPAGAVHYDGAKDVETIVEIRGLGPVETTSVWRGGGKVSE